MIAYSKQFSKYIGEIPNFLKDSDKVKSSGDSVNIENNFLFTGVLKDTIKFLKDEYSEKKYICIGESENMKKYRVTDNKELEKLHEYLDILLKDLCEHIILKNPEFIDEPLFIESFFRVFNYIILPYKLSIYNFYDYLPDIVKKVNDMFRKDYIVIDCNKDYGKFIDAGFIRKEYPEYRCGRASTFKVGPGLNTRIIIYNSMHEFDNNPDDTYAFSILDKYHGGYYKKYLKYKTKYLKLKNNL